MGMQQGSPITNRLWFRLISAFAVVIAIRVLVTVVVTRQGVASRFAHLETNQKRGQT